MVTVIVLVYRNLSKLDKTIESVLQQDSKDIELIVSDDGSPDFDVDDVEHWIRNCTDYNDNIFLVVRKNHENMGIVKHYNHVIMMSEGQIIIPLSCGDIFYNSNTVTEITKFFFQNNCLFATAKRQCEGAIMPKTQQIKKIYKGGRQLIDSLCRGNFISGSCIYYSRIFFDKYGYFDERLFLVDDYPMLLRVLFSGQSIPFMDKITIIYETSGVSNCKTPNLLFEKDMDKIFELMIEPNKHYLGIETYRHLKCRNYLKTHNGSFRWIYCCLFPDVLILKAIDGIRRLLKAMLIKDEY